MEMTGIPTRLTGVPYKLWIGTTLSSGKHNLPYVKVMDGRTDLISISINDPIKVLVGDGFSISTKELDRIKIFITRNRETLLNFYYHGTDNGFDDEHDFYQKLVSVAS
jgi:hypothetical protein